MSDKRNLVFFARENSQNPDPSIFLCSDTNQHNENITKAIYLHYRMHFCFLEFTNRIHAFSFTSRVHKFSFTISFHKSSSQFSDAHPQWESTTCPDHLTRRHNLPRWRPLPRPNDRNRRANPREAAISEPRR